MIHCGKSIQLISCVSPCGRSTFLVNLHHSEENRGPHWSFGRGNVLDIKFDCFMQVLTSPTTPRRSQAIRSLIIWNQKNVCGLSLLSEDTTQVNLSNLDTLGSKYHASLMGYPYASWIRCMCFERHSPGKRTLLWHHCTDSIAPQNIAYVSAAEAPLLTIVLLCLSKVMQFLLCLYMIFVLHDL